VRLGRRLRGETLDDWVETASRWTAERTTRRSFLGKVGRAGFLLAAGPTLATVLAERAEGRVCGQTGYVPVCPTFDCDEGVWGWCWYASGCCAGGYLKKICDCCVWQYPSVQGYCDSGYTVKCLVESCGTDPRVLSVPMKEMDTSDLLTTAVEVAKLRFPNGSPTVVLADGDEPLFWAIALGLGGIVGGAVLPLRERRLDPKVLEHIRAMKVSVVTIVGPALPGSIDTAIAEQGFTVERVGRSAEVGEFSAEVARWARGLSNREVRINARPQLLTPRFGGDVSRCVCVVPQGLSAEAVPLAAALAGALGYPLVVGEAAARAAGVPAYLVGPEAARHEAQLPGSRSLVAASLVELGVDLARLAYDTEKVAPETVLLAPTDSAALLALAGMGVPIVVHEPGILNRAPRGWLYALVEAYGPPHQIYIGGPWQVLGLDGWYEVQSAVNGFETRRLVGRDGDGYPFEQPWYEQGVGAARVDSEVPSPPPRSSSTYWGGRVRRQ